MFYTRPTQEKFPQVAVHIYLQYVWTTINPVIRWPKTNMTYIPLMHYRSKRTKYNIKKKYLYLKIFWILFWPHRVLYEMPVCKYIKLFHETNNDFSRGVVLIQPNFFLRSFLIIIFVLLSIIPLTGEYYRHCCTLSIIENNRLICYINYNNWLMDLFSAAVELQVNKLADS